MAWTWDYAPGEQKEIRLGYRVKWPADRELMYEPRPIGPTSPTGLLKSAPESHPACPGPRTLRHCDALVE